MARLLDKEPKSKIIKLKERFKKKPKPNNMLGKVDILARQNAKLKLRLNRVYFITAAAAVILVMRYFNAI